MNETLTFK